MTTAKRQTLADFMYYSLCAGPDQGRAVRLLAAAAQPGAGRLRADRQAQEGRPAGRPHRPRRALVQQPDLRRQEPLEEQARRDRAAARRLRQGRRRARAAPTPAPTSRRPTTRTRRPTPARRPAGDPGGGRARRRRRRDSGPVVDPDTGEVSTPAPVDPAAGGATPRGQQSADFPAPTELAPSRPADTTTFGWVAAALLLALVLLPGLWSSTCAADRAAEVPP